MVTYLSTQPHNIPTKMYALTSPRGSINSVMVRVVQSSGKWSSGANVVHSSGALAAVTSCGSVDGVTICNKILL